MTTARAGLLEGAVASYAVGYLLDLMSGQPTGLYTFLGVFTFLAGRLIDSLLDVRGATLKGWGRRARAGTLGPNRMGRPPVERDAGAVARLEELMLEAGADVVETCTFRANRLTMAEARSPRGSAPLKISARLRRPGSARCESRWGSAPPTRRRERRIVRAPRGR